MKSNLAILLMILLVVSATACSGSDSGTPVESTDTKNYDSAPDEGSDLNAPLSEVDSAVDKMDTSMDDDFILADSGDLNHSDSEGVDSMDDLAELPPDVEDNKPDTAIEVIPIAEEIVEEPYTQTAEAAIIVNESWASAIQEPQFTSVADFTQEYEGQLYQFRPWIRFRMPHPGMVKKLYLYTTGSGAIQVQLSTGFPGGHYPCLYEGNGKPKYGLGKPYLMETSDTPGWRVLDVGELQHKVGGLDEFFVIFAQQQDARVGLALHNTAEVPGDYENYGGIIADVPGDGMLCFPTYQGFVGPEPEEEPLIWMVRAEIETTTMVEEPLFQIAPSNPQLGGQFAFGDYDNDGDEDLLISGRLFANDGGEYFEITDDVGLTGLGGQTIWGDYNNDGHTDILSNGGGGRLYYNQGDGMFLDVTAGSEIAMDANSQGIAWVDVDNDGLLDFYAASYGTSEDSEVAKRDYLWRNNGDGSFTDITAAAGIKVDGEMSHGRGVACADYDDDGFIDIYVGNYRLDPNQLYRNLGDGYQFEDTAADAGVKGKIIQGYWGHTIGPSWGDFTNDGLFDLVVPNLAHPRFFSFSDHTFIYINEGDGSFKGFKPPEKGVLYDETHSDSTLLDYDNDGDLDLYLTSVYEGRRAYLYSNDGSGSFEDVTYAAGIEVYNGWGSASADVDNDGDLDLMSRTLYINSNKSNHHFLKIKLVGGATSVDPTGWSNRDAIGATVELELQDGILLRQVEGGTGVGCQNSKILHFGLGGESSVAGITVRWPSGIITSLTSVDSDQTLEIYENEE